MQQLKRLFQFFLRPWLRPIVWALVTFVAWWTWMGLIMGALALVNGQVLPAGLFESLKVALTVVMLVGLTVLYLAWVKESSWREGLLVGLVAAAVTVALDAWFYYRLTGTPGTEQLVNAIPAYIVMPLVTMLILGCLRKR